MEKHNITEFWTLDSLNAQLANSASVARHVTFTAKDSAWFRSPIGGYTPVGFDRKAR